MTSFSARRSEPIPSIKEEQDHEYSSTCRYGRKGTAVKRGSIVKLALVGVAATVIPIIGAGSAFADYAPQPGDVVGIGGDTPQYAVDFALNGAPTDAFGFDQTATVNRVIQFDATPDANGRSALPAGQHGILSEGAEPDRRASCGRQPRATGQQQWKRHHCVAG